MQLFPRPRVDELKPPDTTIFAVSKLAKIRDSQTARHAERVALYSRVLARQLSIGPSHVLQCTREFIRLIYQTSPLHDIGKIDIPDAILRKPGRLSVEEYDVMKTHPSIGAKMIDAAIRENPDARFLRMARDIAATHHEKWDGSGYPNQLVGTQIPLAGRIVALADVYDAMTSPRSYKPALSHAWVTRTIIDSGGTHFDPDVVQAFIETEAQFVNILTTYGEQSASDTRTFALNAA